MQRQKKVFPLLEENHDIFKKKMLDWSKQFSIFIYLDNNNYSGKYHHYECLLAVKPVWSISANGCDTLAELHQWHVKENDWLFGHICYDYKNLLESKRSSAHTANFDFILSGFFCPEIVCFISNDKRYLHIESLSRDPDNIFREISEIIPEDSFLPKINFKQRNDRANYIVKIEDLRKHIGAGDCYEINFCNEGFAENVLIDPITVFKKLNDISPAPFAAFYKLQGQYLMCASPERYLHKDGDKIIAQPIKGTARRDSDAQKDELIKTSLANSNKDKAENVMITDLMRNDLARSCEVGSIKVEELFGIYSFPQVHQMISTITGILQKDMPFTDAIRYSFPMGSMTGAPKIKVMQLIEEYESSGRELFSGTVGYISPDGNFDFNVIIRSLFYNAVTRYLSYQTGGAITYDSDPQQEWEEMRLKAWAIEKIFS